MPDHLVHPGVSAGRLAHLDHGTAHLPHQELRPLRPAGGHLVRAADESLQQRRLCREESQVWNTQL